MRLFTSGLIVLIMCASCTSRERDLRTENSIESSAAESDVATPSPVLKLAGAEKPGDKPVDRESQKVVYWFEQMDAIFREALWVIRQEKAPQGKSIFGKMQRALLVNMKQKLSNKSLFRCDVYSMTRNISGLTGVPQDAEVFHQCNTKESFIKIGDWKHAKTDELTMSFRGSNLSEVLGFATGVLSPQISCKLKSAENGIIESFSCSGLMLDYNPAKNQVLRFNQFDYQKTAKNMLRIKAEVLESLDPVRKIDVEIPLEGKILVTETVLQEPQFLAKPVPAVTPLVVKPASPGPAQVAPEEAGPERPDAISAEDKYHDQNGQEIDRGENPQERGIRHQTPEGPPQEGGQESYQEGDFEGHGSPQEEGSVNEPPRERNTR